MGRWAGLRQTVQMPPQPQEHGVGVRVVDKSNTAAPQILIHEVHKQNTGVEAGAQIKITDGVIEQGSRALSHAHYLLKNVKIFSSQAETKAKDIFWQS